MQRVSKFLCNAILATPIFFALALSSTSANAYMNLKHGDVVTIKHNQSNVFLPLRGDKRFCVIKNRNNSNDHRFALWHVQSQRYLRTRLLGKPTFYMSNVDKTLFSNARKYLFNVTPAVKRNERVVAGRNYNFYFLFRGWSIAYNYNRIGGFRFLRVDRLRLKLEHGYKSKFMFRIDKTGKSCLEAYAPRAYQQDMKKLSYVGVRLPHDDARIKDLVGHSKFNSLVDIIPGALKNKFENKRVNYNINFRGNSATISTDVLSTLGTGCIKGELKGKSLSVMKAQMSEFKLTVSWSGNRRERSVKIDQKWKVKLVPWGEHIRFSLSATLQKARRGRKYVFNVTDLRGANNDNCIFSGGGREWNVLKAGILKITNANAEISFEPRICKACVKEFYLQSSNAKLFGKGANIYFRKNRSINFPDFSGELKDSIKLSEVVSKLGIKGKILNFTKNVTLEKLKFQHANNDITINWYRGGRETLKRGVRLLTKFEVSRLKGDFNGSANLNNGKIDFPMAVKFRFKGLNMLHKFVEDALRKIPGVGGVVGGIMNHGFSLKELGASVSAPTKRNIDELSFKVKLKVFGVDKDIKFRLGSMEPKDIAKAIANKIPQIGINLKDLLMDGGKYMVNQSTKWGKKAGNSVGKAFKKAGNAIGKALNPRRW